MAMLVITRGYVMPNFSACPVGNHAAMQRFVHEPAGKKPQKQEIDSDSALHIKHRFRKLRRRAS